MIPWIDPLPHTLYYGSRIHIGLQIFLFQEEFIYVCSTASLSKDLKCYYILEKMVIWLGRILRPTCELFKKRNIILIRRSSQNTRRYVCVYFGAIGRKKSLQVVE